MSDEKDARIRELEERLHERDLAVAALSQQLAACNPPQDSDAERTPPPNPSGAVEGGDDSSADAASDRRVITWHDAGDEHDTAATTATSSPSIRSARRCGTCSCSEQVLNVANTKTQ